MEVHVRVEVVGSVIGMVEGGRILVGVHAATAVAAGTSLRPAGNSLRPWGELKSIPWTFFSAFLILRLGTGTVACCHHVG